MSYEAERAVIGSMILEPQLIDEVSVNLTEKDFTSIALQTLYTELLKMNQKRELIDVVTLTTRLQEKEKIRKIPDGYEYIHSLVGGVLATSTCLHYAEIIKKQSVRKRALEVAEQIREMSEHPVICLLYTSPSPRD